MTRLTTEQWLLFAGFLAAIATMIGSLDNWHQAVKPVFVGGVITQLAIQIRSLFTTANPPSGGSSSQAQKLGILFLVCTLGAGAAVLSSCGGKNPPVNVAPTLNTQTDQDVLGALAKALVFLKAAGAVVNQASLIEAQAVGMGAVSPAIDKTFKTAVGTIKAEALKVIDDIDGKVITTYAQAKTRIDPILGAIDTLRKNVPSGQSFWSQLGSVLINLAVTILDPGFLSGSPLAPALAH